MTPSEIVNMIVAIGSLIPTIISVVVLIVNIVKNKNWKLVMSIADEAMRTVEDYSKVHPGMTSEAKLDMALEAVKSGLAVAGIKVDTALLKRVIEYIRESINWFNEMK